MPTPKNFTTNIHNGHPNISPGVRIPFINPYGQFIIIECQYRVRFCIRIKKLCRYAFILVPGINPCIGII